MGRIVVTEFVSLDGVMEAPGGEQGYRHTNWVFPFHGPDTLAYKFDEIVNADAHLLGRVTYESFAGAWPQRTGEFAERMNAMPKYVASTTLQEPLEWNNSQLLKGDVAEAVSKLKQDDGELLVAGSRTLVHTLMENDLVDEYHLMIFPVVLGSGKRVFPDTPDKTTLKLVDSRTFDSGAVVQAYEPATSG
jgi:dihydrofolate reductase